MRKSRFSEEQIFGILRLAEAGQTVAEVCRQHAISEGTYDRWKAQYGGLEVSQLRRLRQSEEDNRRLKQIVAGLTLDNMALRDIATKSPLPNGQQWTTSTRRTGCHSDAPVGSTKHIGVRYAISHGCETTSHR